MTTLTIIKSDRLELAAGDTLAVDSILNEGELYGAGAIQTSCADLVNSGILAETIQILCMTAGYLIEEFAGMEPVYLNDTKLLKMATAANSIPAARREFQ